MYCRRFHNFDACFSFVQPGLISCEGGFDCVLLVSPLLVGVAFRQGGFGIRFEVIRVLLVDLERMVVGLGLVLRGKRSAG